MRLAFVSLVAIASVTVALAGGSPRVKITIWPAPSPASSVYGGLSYGGATPASGAMITQQVDVDVSAAGEARIGNLASTLDPASVQVRDLTDTKATVVEQRFTSGATTPTAVIARYVGQSVTAITPKGEITGVLRSVDAGSLALEVGSGDQRRLQVLRRDYVHDLRLPPGPSADRGSLALELATKRPGTHTLELSYRTLGLQWSADYVAVLDETASSVDFSAWANIKNLTGAAFDAADVSLVDNLRTSLARTPVRYAIAQPVKLPIGQEVQVQLVPPQRKTTAKTVVVYEAIPDLSAGFQSYANIDCTLYNGNTGPGTAEIVVEVDVPTKDPLPAGRVRMFRRTGDRVEAVSEELLRSRAGAARIRLDRSQDITGDRKATACTNDEKARTLTEKVELALENTGKRARDVVVREYAWRWTVFRLDAESQKSVSGGPQSFEYRVTLPPGGKRTLGYTLVYSW